MILSGFIVWAIAGSVFNDTFDRANQAYLEGQYDVAIAGYEQLVSEDVIDPVVFYNLGNAYLLTAQTGPAIANYERALQEDPGMTAARQNLQIALARLPRQTAPPPVPDWHQAVLFWDKDLRPRTVVKLAVISWLAFWSIMGFGVWRGFRKLRALLAVAAVAALFLCLSGWVKTHPFPVAVVNRATIAYSGMNVKAEERFALSPGDRVHVDAIRDDWMRVTNPKDNIRGWAHGEDLTLIGPPYIRKKPDIAETKM
ncbi:MAG: tetratricopeptide repeat protein [Candidatus Hydrogenedentes bacterium]|nr:tetratricopeptide repeat protein [Candidatus Hydrogenedentota bacterium]